MSAMLPALVAIWLGAAVSGVIGQSSVTTTDATATATEAQTATGAPTTLPSCPNSCLNDVLTGVTPSGCDVVSVDCICASTQGLRSIMCCVKGRCSEQDQQVTVSTWIDTCAGLATAPDFLNQLGCVNSTGTLNATSSASSSSPSRDTSTNHGLSKGSRIGIGVGVGLGGLALAAFCLIFLIRQRRKRSTTPTINEFEKAELDGSGAVQKAELDANGEVIADEKRMTHELNSPQTIHEINSESYPLQELPGSVPQVQELDGRTKLDREIN